MNDQRTDEQLNRIAQLERELEEAKAERNRSREVATKNQRLAQIADKLRLQNMELSEKLDRIIAGIKDMPAMGRHFLKAIDEVLNAHRGTRRERERRIELESQLTAHKAALVKASEVWFGHTLACSINRLQSGMKCTCNLDTRRDEALTAINEVLEEKK